MKRVQYKMMFGAAMIVGMAATGAIGQTAEPSYKADPDVYKLTLEDANFRVIESTRKAGVRDKAHSHPAPSVVYYLTDCKSKIYDSDGKVRETNWKAGTVRANPVIASHSAENIGVADCKEIFVEKK